MEREAKEEARKAHADAEARNAELVKKVEDSDRKVDQIQELVQRFVKSLKKGGGLGDMKRIFIVFTSSIVVTSSLKIA